MAITQKDLDQIENRLETNFATKEDLMKFKSDFFDKIDPILKEVVASREERSIVGKNISDHEERVSKLESVGIN